jgi:hypothetical protein
VHHEMAGRMSKSFNPWLACFVLGSEWNVLITNIVDGYFINPYFILVPYVVRSNSGVVRIALTQFSSHLLPFGVVWIRKQIVHSKAGHFIFKSNLKINSSYSFDYMSWDT